MHRLLCLLAVALLLSSGQARSADEPPVVSVCKPVVREVQDYEKTTGRLEPAGLVELRSRITGYVEKVHFEEGQLVKEGDLLFTLDARLQKVELARAEAELARAQAQLELAKRDLERAEKLAAANARNVDLEPAKAKYEEAKAVVAALRASAEVAKLNLDWTRITAPAAGRIGRAFITAGNLVTADNPPVLATIQSSDSIHVVFPLEERSLLRIMRSLPAAAPQAPRLLPVEVALSDEQGYPHRGTANYDAIQVNPKNDTPMVRATLPNPRGQLTAALFVKVRVPVGKLRQVLTVPTRALVVLNRTAPPALPGASTEPGDIEDRVVWVVRDNQVESRAVKARAVADKSWVVIEEGLKADDRVVVDLPKDVRPGMQVKTKEIESPK
jgi:multidrug efflux system membrane fusion protein